MQLRAFNKKRFWDIRIFACVVSAKIWMMNSFFLYLNDFKHLAKLQDNVVLTILGENCANLTYELSNLKICVTRIYVTQGKTVNLVTTIFILRNNFNNNSWQKRNSNYILLGAHNSQSSIQFYFIMSNRYIFSNNRQMET